jgi:putative transposase
LLADPEVAQMFVDHLLVAKRKLGLKVHAYVVMPEHVHLLVWSPRVIVEHVLRETKARFAFAVIQAWKSRQDARLDRIRMRDGSFRFWLKGGGYDQQMVHPEAILGMTVYIHQNPVRRQLVQIPTDWPWSSARAYASGEDNDLVDLWSR